MTTRRLITRLMGVIVAVALTGCTSAPTIQPQAEPPIILQTIEPTVSTTPTLQMVSGTIRWVSSTEWVILDNAAHTPTGLASVTVMADRVRVSYDFTAATVSSLQATSDEAFASADVRVGASVGLNYTDIYFYMPSHGSNPVDPRTLSKSWANVWITGWFWVDPA